MHGALRQSKGERLTIVCSGKLAGTTVGHIDHFMGYAAGLRRLGHEVYVVDNAGSGRCTDGEGRRVAFESWPGRRHFEAMAKSYGFWPRCCLIYKDGRQTHGMSFADVAAVARRSDLLLTRSGQVKVAEILEAPKTRVYVDGNPGSTQSRLEASGGEFDNLDRYEGLYTMGLNVGTPASPIPTAGRSWRPILRPVVLEMWPAVESRTGGRFTTISSWTGRSTFELKGRHSGEKSDSWQRFIALPRRTSQAMEIALRLTGADRRTDAMAFRDRGWHLVDPEALRTFGDYRDYIGGSRAEFSVAHNRYVEFSTAWFSDRSALYLASGRPVLVQSTGIEAHLPTGRGLLTYRTMEEALAGIAAINGDYEAHCRAARGIAEDYFDSAKVLGGLLDTIGA